MKRMGLPWLASLLACNWCATALAQTGENADRRPSREQEIYDSERSTEGFLSPQEALATIQLPAGFSATLFAGEPDVRQPIALATDDRGRLWVAENYTYAENKLNFDTRLRDRILIFEDRDNDGRFDRRTVFWDEAERLSSIAIGLGGVWAMCSPNLLFIPDADRDDVPDGPPHVLLDGWDDDQVRHNIANGLRFGPDGWLYGRHGILSTSYVGRPGAPAGERTAINCGIWRFHPTRHDFEVVVHGTTNPWGHDWDVHGELFFINTVIGHLWHALPGAHFERMYGDDFNPHLYELIPQTADHFHWDTREAWSDVRQSGVTATSSAAGGGHAHSGLMIYQGDNWPAEYRGDVFAINFHGRRINRDHLRRRGATFVATHKPDVLQVGDPWFRGLDLIYGPDGGVFCNDWSDTGECHDHDGVHRSSGRIYKIIYGAPPAPRSIDVASLTNDELVRLQLAENDWWVRRARMELQHRAASGADMAEVRSQLFEMFQSQADVTRQLRAMWCLHSIGSMDDDWLIEQLDHESEHVRVWAVRLLVDRGRPTNATVNALATLSASEQSGLTLSYLAAALQKHSLADRWPLALNLAAHAEFSDDPVYPRIVWYGIEPAVPTNVERAIELAQHTQIAKLRRFIARRLTAEIAQNPDGVDQLVRLIGRSRASEQVNILQGMTEALRGWRKAEPPAAWESVSGRLSASDDRTARQLAAELGVVFGDGRAGKQLRLVVEDAAAATDSRRRALRMLLQSEHEGLSPLLIDLLDDRELAPDAIRGLAALGNAETAAMLIKAFPRLRPPAQAAALDGMTSRREYALELLAAVAKETIDAGDVPVYQIRRMRLLNQPEITQRLDRLWPQLTQLTSDKTAQIERYRSTLAVLDPSAADMENGRTVYVKSCATCHKLFGEGGDAGPDLTGSNRGNLDYLLLNLLDPSGEVAQQYRTSNIQLVDGRVLLGVVSPATEQTLNVRTPTENLVLDKSAVETMEQTPLSLMPEGLLQALPDDDVRDVMAYLMNAGGEGGYSP